MDIPVVENVLKLNDEVAALNRATLRHKLRVLGLAVDKVLVDEPRKEASAED